MNHHPALAASLRSTPIMNTQAFPGMFAHVRARPLCTSDPCSASSRPSPVQSGRRTPVLPTRHLTCHRLISSGQRTGRRYRRLLRPRLRPGATRLLDTYGHPSHGMTRVRGTTATGKYAVCRKPGGEAIGKALGESRASSAGCVE